MENTLFTQREKSTWGDWAEWHRDGLSPQIKANRFDDAKGNRFYWWLDDAGEVVTAAGITSWLKEVMPTSSFLIEWMVDYGSDYMTVLNLTADYGTAMHACFAHILIHGEYPPKEMLDVARNFSAQLKKYDKNVKLNQIDKDIASFIQWTRDYSVKPLMVEAILPCVSFSGSEWYCMTADLPCEITLTETYEEQDGVLKSGPNKGQPKMVKRKRERTITAIVDFKSNPFGKDKKGFYESHKMQLIGTKIAMMQNFNIKADALYNWSPDGWKTEPKYTFYEHKCTDADYQLYGIYERIASLKGAFSPKGSIAVFNDKWSVANYDAMLVENYKYSEFVKVFLIK